MVWNHVRKARRRYRCYRCLDWIEVGDRYLRMVLSPDHDGMGYPGWWSDTECRKCAKVFGRMT